MDTTKQTILIIEDDAGLIELLNDSILECGYSTLCASTAKDAFDQLKKNTVDLILLDFSLPDMTGKEFISELKTTSAVVPPFIVATGRGDERTAVEMMKLGARDYIVKDSHFLEFIQIVLAKICNDIRNEKILKNTQDAFKELSAFNNQIIDCAQEGIVVYGSELEILTWNRFMENITGSLSADIVGKRIHEAFPHKKEVELEESVNRALKGEQIPELEFSFKHLITNEIVWVSDIVSTLRNVEGEIVGAISTVRDITEKKRAEKETQKINAEFKELFDNAPIGYHEIDMEGRIVRMNQTELNMLGYTIDEVIGKYIWDLIAESEYSKKQTELKLDVIQPDTLPYERNFLCKDGEKLSVLLKDRQLVSESGEIIGNRSSVQDISERKLAEETLKLRETYLTAIIENLPGMIWLKDTESHIQLANTKFAHTFGSEKPEDLFGKTDLDFSPKEHAEQYLADDKKVVTSKKPLHVEELIYDQSSIKWFETFKMPIFDDNNEVIGTAGYAQDISERKEAQLEIERIGKHYQAIIEKSPDGFVLLDHEMRFSYASPTATKMFGYNQADLAATDPNDITHPDDLSFVLPQLRRLLEEPTYVPIIEYRFRHKNGEWIWIESTFSNLFNDPAVQAVVINFKNINERKLAEQKLRMSEEKFRAVFQNSIVGKSLTSFDGQVSVNKSFAEIVGYSVEELSNMKWMDFTHKDDIEYNNQVIKSIFAGEFLSAHWEKRYIHKTGRIVWVDISTTFLRNTHGKSGNIITEIYDITARKQAEFDLQNNRNLLNNLLHTNTELIESASELIDYKTISDKILEISGASYGSFNMLCENKLDFITVAVSGVDNLQQSLKSMLGYDLIGKTWKYDKYKQEKIAGKTISKFVSLAELSGAAFSKKIISLVTKMFHLGEVWVVQVKKKDVVLGDFTLLFEQGKTICNEEILELYVSQLGLYVERVNSENALRTSEELYRNLVQRIPDGVYKSTAAGKFIDVNPGMVNMLGYNSKEELMAIDIISDLYFDQTERETLLMNHTSALIAVFRLKKKDGSEIWVEDHGWINVGEDGKVLSHEGVLRDITLRKLAEDTVKSSNSLLNGTLESTADGLLVVDRDGRTTVYNQKFAEMWHIPAELLEVGIDEQMLRYVLTQLDNPNEFINKVNDLYKHPELSSIDDIKLADGRIFERYSIPQRVNETIVGRVWSFRDITKRIHAEKTLRISEANLSEALQISSLSFWEYNAPKDMFVFNDQFYSVYNTTVEEQGGYAMSSSEYVKRFVHPNDIKIVEDEISKMLGSLNPDYSAKIEHRIICGNGTVKYISVNVRLDEIKDGILIRAVGANQDITERKKNEILLAESEMFFRQSQKAGKIGSYNLSLETGLWDSSEVLNEIFGIDDNYVKSVEGWSDIVAPEDREMMSTYFSEYVVGQRMPFNKEYRIQRKSDDEVRWVLGRGELLIENNNIKFMFGTIQDVDERKKAEIQLQEKMDELMRFHSLTIGRELTMIELKKELNDLLIKSGQEPKYKIVE